MNDREIAFAETFVSLYIQARRAGEKVPKVGRRAALVAGYGHDSWCERNRIFAADNAYHRNIKKPAVLAYMAELGLMKHGKHWREVQPTRQNRA